MSREWYDFLYPLIVEHLPSIYTPLADDQMRGMQMYPDGMKIFRAFQITPLEDLKVIILGQNPYHDGSATGIAFANDLNIKPNMSPSLQNILKEMRDDIGHKDLKYVLGEDHSEQGVLLLNMALTVEKGIADSHMDV